MKKVIALALCLVMLALCLASCGSNKTDTTGADAERQKTTLKFAIITDENTTAEGIADMQKAFNDYTRPGYSTAVEFVCFTADEYEAKMEREMDYLDYQKIMQNFTELAEINGEDPEDEALAEILGMDIERVTALRTDAELAARLKAATPLEDEEEEFEPEEDDDTTLVDYPALKESQFDLLVVANSEMYEKYVANGWLAPITTQLTGTYKLITTMMSDRIFAQTKIGDSTDNYAVPTNKAVGKYTYLVFNKEALAEYNISEKEVTGFETVYRLLASMEISENAGHGLSMWKDKYGDGFKPVLNSKEDFLYPCVQFFSQNGTDFSMVGVTYDKNTNFSVVLNKDLNLFTDPSYVSYLRTAFEADSEDYFGDGTGEFLVGIKEGDYGVRNGSGDYYYFPIEMPHADAEEIQHGMLAVSSYSVSVDRSVEVIQKLMTERDLLNTLLYGTKENYDLSTDNIVTLHDNKNYALDPDYPVGNLQALAYPCTNYGQEAATYSNILLHNGDLAANLFDATFFDFFQYMDPAVWQQIDEKSAELLADLMDSEDGDAFEAKLAEILDSFDTEAHPEDPFALLMKTQLDSAQQKTLADALLSYLMSKMG